MTFFLSALSHESKLRQRSTSFSRSGTRLDGHLKSATCNGSHSGGGGVDGAGGGARTVKALRPHTHTHLPMQCSCVVGLVREVEHQVLLGVVGIQEVTYLIKVATRK